MWRGFKKGKRRKDEQESQAGKMHFTLPASGEPCKQKHVLRYHQTDTCGRGSEMCEPVVCGGCTELCESKSNGFISPHRLICENVLKNTRYINQNTAFYCI